MSYKEFYTIREIVESGVCSRPQLKKKIDAGEIIPINIGTGDNKFYRFHKDEVYRVFGLGNNNSNSEKDIIKKILDELMIIKNLLINNDKVINNDFITADNKFLDAGDRVEIKTKPKPKPKPKPKTKQKTKPESDTKKEKKPTGGHMFKNLNNDECEYEELIEDDDIEYEYEELIEDDDVEYEYEEDDYENESHEVFDETTKNIS